MQGLGLCGWRPLSIDSRDHFIRERRPGASAAGRSALGSRAGFVGRDVEGKHRGKPCAEVETRRWKNGGWEWTAAVTENQTSRSSGDAGKLAWQAWSVVGDVVAVQTVDGQKDVVTGIAPPLEDDFPAWTGTLADADHLDLATRACG